MQQLAVHAAADLTGGAQPGELLGFGLEQSSPEPTVGKPGLTVAQRRRVDILHGLLHRIELLLQLLPYTFDDAARLSLVRCLRQGAQRRGRGGVAGRRS